MRTGTDQWGCLRRFVGCLLMFFSLIFMIVGLRAFLSELTGWREILYLVIGVPVWLLAMYLIGGGRADVSSNVRRNSVIAAVIVSIVFFAFFLLLSYVGNP